MIRHNVHNGHRGRKYCPCVCVYKCFVRSILGIIKKLCYYRYNVMLEAVRD